MTTTSVAPLRTTLIAATTAIAAVLALLPAPSASAQPGEATSAVPGEVGLDIDRADRGVVPGSVPGEEVLLADRPGAPAPGYGEPAIAPDATQDAAGVQDAAGAQDAAGTQGNDTGNDERDGRFTTAAAGFAVRGAVRAIADISPAVQINGRGWGHGVGMSQYGAYAMALQGRSSASILSHYYAGTQVTSDPRASSQRIRVGLATGQTATPVRALDGTVTWQICTPGSEPGRNGRVPAANCLAWFEQPAGQALRVKPLIAAGVALAEGTQSTVAGAIVTIKAGAGTKVPAPRGGILIERDTSAAGAAAVWTPYRAYATAAGATLPVARANHGGSRIEAQSYASPDRVYRYGWRDLHLTGIASDPGSHRLAVVQDVSTVERYLRGLAEVPSSWPSASLEAQAITGRTYALRGSRGGTCLCDRLATTADQVFIGESKAEAFQGDRWVAAVEATADRVLTYQGALAETFYSSSHGGRSENVGDSWGYYRAWQNIDLPGAGQPPAYLTSVDDPASLLEQIGGTTIANSRRNWTASASNAAFTALVNAERTTPFVRLERVRVRDRTSGLTPRTLDITGVTRTGARESMVYRGTFGRADGTPSPRPIAGARIRSDLALVGGGEGNGRVSSSQITRFGFAPFTDDDGNTHEYTITWASQAGVVGGISETRFAPNRSVTRAQMATFLNNTFAWPPAPTTTSTFPDVRAGSTHHAAIEAIAAAKITLGYRDGSYRPDAPVTREEMATFLARAQALTASTTGSFSDVPIGSTHDASIQAVAAAGITDGCSLSTFCPRDPVTRGQLATFVYRSVRR